MTTGTVNNDHRGYSQADEDDGSIMARLAIVVLAVFWATVTAGSLVWEVIDPASLPAEQPPQAMPSGLTGGDGGLAVQPTLADLAPGLRASLRETIGEEALAAGPVDPPQTPVAAPTVTEPPRPQSPNPSADSGGDTPSDEPPAQTGATAGETMSAVRPRPRPEPPPSVSAPKSVKVPEARPASRGERGDPRIAEAQSLLASLGYRTGAVDGRMGPQTRAAIKAYEKKGGLKVDGAVDDQLLARLRADARSTSRETGPSSKAAVAAPQAQSFAGRVLGGVQRLISHDFNSVAAPEQLVAYCDTRGDEWIYDRGLDRMRSCADVVGKPSVSFRALPGDR